MTQSPTNRKDPTPISVKRRRLLWNLSLVCASALTNVVVMLVTIYIVGSDKEGWHQAVRNTIRMASLLFFVLLTLEYFSRRFTNPVWTFLRAHRRGLGLGFAAAVVIHLSAVYLYLEHGGRLPSLLALSMDGTAVVALSLMAVTSNDKAVALLSPVRWKILHRTGVWICWFTLLIPFISRIRFDADTSAYWLFSIQLIVALYMWLRPGTSRPIADRRSDAA